MLTFNIVNILVSNVRGVVYDFVNKYNELTFIHVSVTFIEGGLPQRSPREATLFPNPGMTPHASNGYVRRIACRWVPLPT